MNILHVGKYLNGRLVHVELMTEAEAIQWMVWYARYEPAIEMKIIC
jgi:hypothetical protein